MDNYLKHFYPKRKPNRLKHYDYSRNGYYFVTICSKGRQNTFSKIEEVENCYPNVILLPNGKIIEENILKISEIYEHVWIDCFVIMPNHVHLIVGIDLADHTRRQVAAPTLSQIVGGMKRASSMKAASSLWQKSFHEHIIRDEAGYLKISEYIENNPLTWKKDCYFQDT